MQFFINMINMFTHRFGTDEKVGSNFFIKQSERELLQDFIFPV